MVLPNHLRNYDMDKLWHRRKIQVITYSCSYHRRTISAYTPQMAYVCWWPSSSLVLKAARTHAVPITTQNTQLMSIIHHRKYFTTIIIFIEQGLVKYVNPVRALGMDHISIKLCHMISMIDGVNAGISNCIAVKLQYVSKLIYLLSYKFLSWHIIQGNHAFFQGNHIVGIGLYGTCNWNFRLIFIISFKPLQYLNDWDQSLLPPWLDLCIPDKNLYDNWILYDVHDLVK